MFFTTIVLRFKVYSVAPDTNELTMLLEEDFDLARLTLLKYHSNLLAPSLTFPVNCVFIEIEDAIYTSESMYRRCSDRRYYPGKFLAIDSSFDSDTGATSTLLIRKMYESNSKLADIRGEIARAWEQSDNSQFEVSKANKLSKIVQVSITRLVCCYSLLLLFVVLTVSLVQHQYQHLHHSNTFTTAKRRVTSLQQAQTKRRTLATARTTAFATVRRPEEKC